jgi:hypothetical protein
VIGILREVAGAVVRRWTRGPVFVRRIEVGVSGSGAEALQVGYQLGSRGGAWPSTFYATVRNPAVALSSLSIVREGRSAPAPIPAGLLIPLQSPVGSGAVEVRFEVGWPRDRADGGFYLAIPSDLPRVGDPVVGERLPIVHLGSLPAGVRLAGALWRDGEEGPDGLLSAVLAFESDLAVQSITPRTAISIDRRIADGLKDEEIERIARYLGRILAAHAELFGIEPRVCVCVAPLSSRNRDTPPFLTVRDLAPFGLRSGDVPDDVHVASRLAGLWWGAGCRATGFGGGEVAAAFRGAAALLWCDRIGESARRDAMLETWRRRAGRGRVSDALARVRGEVMHGFHGHASALLYEALAGDDGVRRRVAELTRQSWGLTISAQHVRTELAGVGIRI